MDFLSLGISSGTLLALMAITVRAAMKFAIIETKVDTMWAFQMRRALTEVVSSGVGTINSPIIFSVMAHASLDPIKAELIAWWGKVPQPVKDLDAMLLIEQRFGEVLVRLVCIPCGLSHGACLLLALTIAKQSNEISFTS